MRLTHLSLHGYHGFRDLELAFPERGPTVLIGKNGAGKSTVLDAVAIFLGYFAALASHPPSRHKRGASVGLEIAADEVHREESGARVVALFSAGGRRLVGRAVHRDRSWNLGELLDTTPLDAFIYDTLLPALAEDRQAPIPVLAYYRPNRGIGLELGKKARPPAYPQLAAYVRALDAQVGPFQGFVRWFRLEEDRENEVRLRKDPRHRDRRLQAVRDAIERFLSALSPGTFRNLRAERDVDLDTGADLPAQILIDKGEISLPLSHLSDGERSMLLLVADLAMRLVVANPAAEEPLRGAGIVLIDEVELHLHPAWQRAVLPALSAVFPGCQIIATTHSPQILSTLEPESVVILESFRRVELTPPTYGRDTNALLLEVMHTPPRPQQAADKLDRIARLIDAEDYGGARAALDDLSGWLGDRDPEIVRLRALTEVLES